MPVFLGLLTDSDWHVQKSAADAFSILASYGKKANIWLMIVFWHLSQNTCRPQLSMQCQCSLNCWKIVTRMSENLQQMHSVNLQVTVRKPISDTAFGFLFFHGKTVEEQRKKFLCFQILEKKRKRVLFVQGPPTFSLFFHHFSMKKWNLSCSVTEDSVLTSLPEYLHTTIANAMPVILELLKDSDWHVRESAADAFSKLAHHGMKANIWLMIVFWFLFQNTCIPQLSMQCQWSLDCWKIATRMSENLQQMHSVNLHITVWKPVSDWW